MNKKQFLKSVIFITMTLVLLITLTYMLRTNGSVKERFVGFYAEEDNSIDVITVGSSPVFPYYSAPQLYGETGIVMYPLATNLQRPKAVLPLVEEARKTQSPELFVFEMRMFTNSDEELTGNMAYTRGVTDNMKHSWNRIKTIQRLVEEDGEEERYTYYFDIFKYHSNWKTLIYPSQWVCFDYSHLDPHKGFVINDEVGPAEKKDYSHIQETEAMPQDSEELLRELLNYLKENELQALFVVSPYAMEDGKQQVYNYMSEIIEEYGYSFLNLNDYYEELEIDFSEDFYDYGVHTNALGSEKCTRFLGDYLQKNYNLQDRRGQENYQSWEDAYRLWQEEHQAAVIKIKERIKNKDYAPVPGEE